MLRFVSKGEVVDQWLVSENGVIALRPEDVYARCEEPLLPSLGLRRVVGPPTLAFDVRFLSCLRLANGEIVPGGARFVAGIGDEKSVAPYVRDVRLETRLPALPPNDARVRTTPLLA